MIDTRTRGEGTLNISLEKHGSTRKAIYKYYFVLEIVGNLTSDDTALNWLKYSFSVILCIVPSILATGASSYYAKSWPSRASMQRKNAE